MKSIPPSPSGLKGICAGALGFLFLLPVQAAILSFEGITEAIHDVTVSAKVAGTIEGRPVNEGDPVEKGQVIFEFERDAEKLEMARRKLLWESKAEVTAAATDERLKKDDYETTKKLAEKTGSVSKDDVAIKELEYVKAKAEHQRLQTVEKREEIEYNIAKEDHDRRVVLSPIKGFIAQMLYQEGEDAKSQEPLARVVDITRCYFVSNVAGSAGKHLSKGQSVDLEIQDGDSKVKLTGSMKYSRRLKDGMMPSCLVLSSRPDLTESKSTCQFIFRR